MDVVVYARYSPGSGQDEQSIEGQLDEINKYCKLNNFNIIENYIDKGKSGKSDNRDEFLRMIDDSKDKNKTWNAIIVYKLDRFARDKYDSAVYKRELKKNGVRVLSSMEKISEDASGILMEGMLETIAEYYSAELGEKLKRGMGVNAKKCYYNGGSVPLGFKLEEAERLTTVSSKEKIKWKFAIDEETAPIVKKIFQMYSNGSTMFEIIKYLNEQNLRTSKDNKFNKNSLRRLFLNKKYIGIYTYDGKETPDGVPRIIEDDLFYQVQDMLLKNRKAPARGKGKLEYLLTTKLFCGYCKDMMIGYTGTSRTEKVYNYYSCKKSQKKLCDKKNVRKDYIEDKIAQKVKEMLTKESIDIITKSIIEANERQQDTANLKRLNNLLSKNEKQKSNLIDSLKMCDIESVKKSIFEEIAKMEVEHKELQLAINKEEKNRFMLGEKEVRFFLTGLMNADITKEINKKALINVFVNRIYLYDDKYIGVFNISDKTIEITVSLEKEIESSLLGTFAAPKCFMYEHHLLFR
ncbi:MAG: recombinase family protein [Bacilli bacterium]